MIQKNEIDIMAQELDIHVSNVQRDYVFNWILHGIYELSDLSNYFILKGGNCLRKAYLKNTRFSSDLDFSIQYSLSLEYIGKEFNLICTQLEQIIGINFHNDRNIFKVKNRADKSLNVYDVRLYFTDFYGEESKIVISVRLDITQFEKIHLPIQTRNLIHPYSDYNKVKTKLKCIKLEEILASKLKCLIQRRHSSDFYDYAYSLMIQDELALDNYEILTVFLKKTIFQRSPEAARRLLLGLPFEVLKNLYAKYVVAPKLGRINFEEGIEAFKQNIMSLFHDSGERSERFFFPPELRDPIMEAGANQTLLKIHYKGVVRFIEPYSLIYKVRNDGIGQEYFYAYDTTGGLKSGPGLKSFTNDKIIKVEVTDIKFDPRYEIELRKAGEFGRNTYFSKPFGSGEARINKRQSRPEYIFKCAICGKVSKRKSRKYANMRKHKDDYGNNCYGKRAIFIGKDVL